MATDVSSVVAHFPKPQNGFATTLGSTIAHGAATVVLASTGNYSNGDVVVLVIEPTSSTAKEVFTGIINTSSVSVSSCVWTATAAGSPAHTAGVAIVDYTTATHIAMVSKGMLVSHNADGTMKTSLTLTTPTIASLTNAQHDHSNAAGGGSLGAGVVTNSMLAANAAWTSFTPTWNGTLGASTILGKYQQIGKTVNFRISLTLGAGFAFNGASMTFTLPVTAAVIAGLPIGRARLNRVGVNGYWLGTLAYNTTTTCIIFAESASGGFNAAGNVTPTSPGTWATNDTFDLQGIYEAA